MTRDASKRNGLAGCERRVTGTDTTAEAVLQEYCRTRRDWRRFTFQLPDGELLVVGDLCRPGIGRHAIDGD